MIDKGARTTNASATGEIALLTSKDSALFSRLLVMPGSHTTKAGTTLGLILFTDGDEAQDTMWIECIVSATSRLNDDLVQMPWKAAIGPMPQNPMNGTTRLSLTKSVTIDDMTVAPLGMCVEDRFYEWQFPSLTSLPTAQSWPVAVSGTAVGFDKHNVSEPVTRDVVLLCAVFSLASGIPWVVRELPFIYGDNEIHMAEDFYGPRYPDRVEGPTELVLPVWADTAYRFAKESDDYRNALLMFSEALQLEGPHPSITLVAYMSSLQSLGRLIETRDNKQLEAILRRVRGEDQVKSILRYYGHRSSTAHHGVLWGTEAVAHSGGLEFNPFVPFDPPFFSTLIQVKEVTIDAFSWVLEHRFDFGGH